jgi:crotonobetainyl-CoA:carnitine CoA-transferase CaiB-like acyl-CoA transferase
MAGDAVGALAGIRVLDLSRVLAAPWATQMLADLGADVIKVERPGVGDDARIYGPAWLPDENGKPSRESSFFVGANRNKRSIAVDFSKPEGREIIVEIAKRSDVLMENFIAGAMARVGLDYETLRAINPRLVYCSLTGYGQSGPYSSRPGYDAVFQAQSGLMSVTGIADGEPGGGPMRIGPSLVDITTGYNAAIGILAALLHRDRISGEGQHIDIALLDTAVAMQSHMVQGYLVDGVVPERKGTVGNGGHPSKVFSCRDGTIYISAGNQKQHQALCDVLGISEIAREPRFATSPLRFDNRHEWDAIAEPKMMERDKFELQAALVAAKVPCSVINDYDVLFDDPHVRHRGIEIEMDHPITPTTKVRMVANPIKLSESPVRYDRPPPMIGQHTEEVLAELGGFDAARLAALREQGVI